MLCRVAHRHDDRHCRGCSCPCHSGSRARHGSRGAPCSLPSPRARDRRRRHPVGRRGQGQAHRPRRQGDARSSSATRAATTPGTPSSSTARRFALQLVPSGILYDHITPVIGNGVVVDPTRAAGRDRHARRPRASTAAGCKVSGNAHLILPYHQELDRAHRAPPRARTSSARPSAASARPTPTRRRASACGCRTCSTRRSSARSSTSCSRRRTRSWPRSSTSCRSIGRRDRRRSTSTSCAPRLEPLHRRHGQPRARGARGRPARAARGRAGHVPRPRPRHLSVRHVVEPGRRRRLHRRRHRAPLHRPGHRHRQGLRAPGSAPGPFPTELFDDDRRPPRRAWPRVRHQHRPPPAPRLVRRGDAAPRRAAQLAVASWRSPSSTCSTRSTR